MIRDEKLSMEIKLKANAELAIRTSSPMFPSFGYNRPSVEWLDGYIERQSARSDLDQATKDGLISVLGSYLGQVIIETIGGKWKETDGRWGVFFSRDFTVFPFAKLEKHLANEYDGGDSILAFYDTTAILAKKYSEKRWWKFW